MNKINKGLLIWNIILTVVLAAAIFSACSSDTRLEWCVTQVQQHSGTIQSLQSSVTTDQAAINNLQQQLNDLQYKTQEGFNNVYSILNKQ